MNETHVSLVDIIRQRAREGLKRLDDSSDKYSSKNVSIYQLEEDLRRPSYSNNESSFVLGALIWSLKTATQPEGPTIVRQNEDELLRTAYDGLLLYADGIYSRNDALKYQGLVKIVKGMAEV